MFGWERIGASWDNFSLRNQQQTSKQCVPKKGTVTIYSMQIITEEEEGAM